ncbi:Rrf2-linked NADH-flavin reductase [Pediococcus damnosus]|uniref:Rrf2-linked NADH-flavin reductase n=1 Tax=Pediococcus damnosus TaxID=51663 RepID=A0A143AZG5_9LACO|nr:NAD(P)H-binding protein [Pediococcus damnosus]AMV60309.1 Rrf2-linked NADH-flavin reductase [Pediococcus damnosus]AMV62838.1 Rrf2-linked NADH-flavin reductase [Pediococcus damnosus]AMV64558.1 Rrf2-linked NADH-flavin reductase [Pediococcus damnosus]AMV67277.1 Rrf2-linked NADH-flavin reductase [Pediococcus damnosus]AMV69578.1 Rrf2-linked NADH-flavin reductase [Pediococcus damnosus]
MKIGIIGATGNTGSSLVKEALGRNHQVTALVRNADKAKSLFADTVTIIAKDAFAFNKQDFAGLDVLIDAISFPTQKHLAYDQLDLAAQLIHMFRETDSPRLVFILGAGSLRTDGGLEIDQLRKTPGAAAWIDTPEAQHQELNFLRTVSNVNWLGVSPSANYTVGPKTAYVRGSDDLLFDDNHKSEVSTGTFAAAILDELEQPSIHQARFTVRNK